MRLAIPTIGTELTLAEDWTFTLFHEGRNRSLAEGLGLQFEGSYRNFRTTDATLPKGTVLSVERVYIRDRQGDFDSITFVVRSSPTTFATMRGKKMPRFWVKLYDANNIQCDFNEETLPK